MLPNPNDFETLTITHSHALEWCLSHGNYYNDSAHAEMTTCFAIKSIFKQEIKVLSTFYCKHTLLKPRTHNPLLEKRLLNALIVRESDKHRNRLINHSPTGSIISFKWNDGDRSMQKAKKQREKWQYIFELRAMAVNQKFIKCVASAGFTWHTRSHRQMMLRAQKKKTNCLLINVTPYN